MASKLDVVAALADSSALPDFDGREVVRATIEVTNAGDGLSAAMAVSPSALHMGDEVYVLIRGEVSKVSHKPLDPKDEDSALVRIQTIKAGDADILSEADVKKVKKSLDKTADNIRRALEAAQGVSRLPGVDDPAVDEDKDDDEIPAPTPIK
jgi:hypothetical protein